MKEILEEEFNKIKEDLIAKHIELGMKASGNWVNSLEVEATDTRARLYAANYTQFLVNGRPPGKFPPIDMIKKWIYDKGIQSELPVNTLAFLIARKISRLGTRYFQQGGTDLIDAVITPKRTQDILDRVGAEMTLQLIDKLERQFAA